MKEYTNEIEYGRKGTMMFVRSKQYPDLEVTGETLRYCFDKYLEEYN
jgi:hypothetical protein